MAPAELSKAIMKPTNRLLPLGLIALLVATTGAPSANAQAPAESTPKVYEPQVGQQGKDVVWVPTSDALVEKMLDLAKVTGDDYVIDLGSGDGRTVIAAARRGARAHGVEYNPDMVELSKRNAQKAGMTGRATFVKADLFTVDLSEATVITMFLLPEINMKLRPTLLNLKPGTRIVSNSFTMEDWQSDETATVEGDDCSSWCTAHLWIVPAKVGGTWKLGDDTLVLKQQFQMLTGTLGARRIANGRVRGDSLSFSVGGARYSGRLIGTGSLKGTVVDGQTGRDWAARRIAARTAVSTPKEPG